MSLFFFPFGFTKSKQAYRPDDKRFPRKGLADHLCTKFIFREISGSGEGGKGLLCGYPIVYVFFSFLRRDSVSLLFVLGTRPYITGTRTCVMLGLIDLVHTRLDQSIPGTYTFVWAGVGHDREVAHRREIRERIEEGKMNQKKSEASLPLPPLASLVDDCRTARAKQTTFWPKPQACADVCLGSESGTKLILAGKQVAPPLRRSDVSGSRSLDASDLQGWVVYPGVHRQGHEGPQSVGRRLQHQIAGRTRKARAEDSSGGDVANE